MNTLQAQPALPASHGSAGGMRLAERAHRESYQWDAFSISDDPGVRAHLRQGFREGFMRGFNACAEMSPAVESLAGEVLSILCPEGHDPEELAQVQEAIRRILSSNAEPISRRREDGQSPNKDSATPVAPLP